jgi:hypothetical protein
MSCLRPILDLVEHRWLCWQRGQINPMAPAPLLLRIVVRIADLESRT